MWNHILAFFQLPAITHGVQFEVGMKLEAVDPLNLSAICPATIMKVRLPFNWKSVELINSFFHQHVYEKFKKNI